MPNDIFISYSRRDLEFVTQLYQDLKKRGFSVWFDQTDIEAGAQWREEIVNGIMACKIFLLVLSPDSTASRNVRKEIDLAESHKKQVVPLRWRKNNLPASVQYQLAGIQYIKFDESASEENFTKLAEILTKLLGGTSMAEAAPDEAVVHAAGVVTQAAKPAQDSGRRAGRTRRGRGRRRGTAQKTSAIAAGGSVMAKVVARMDDFTPKEQDDINEEIKWLFVAADHFAKIRRGEVEATIPVPVDIPPEADVTDNANNALLPNVDDFTLQITEGEINSLIKQIDIYSRNLTIELTKQAQLGGEAASNIALINSIKAQQRGMVERTRELAKRMAQVYGVHIYALDDILDILT